MSLDSYKNMISYVTKNGIDLKKSNIVELGDQMMHPDLQVFLDSKNAYFSRHMKSQGDKILTIDIKGKIRGSLAEKIDLNQKIPDEYVNKFDLLTNFGTSEHVSDQYMVWKNMMSLVKVGGFLYHDIPFRGTWKNHGYVSYDYNMFTTLEKFGLKTLSIIEDHKKHARGKKEHILLWVIQKKEKDEFPTREELGTPWISHKSII